MWSDRKTSRSDPFDLTLEDLIAVQPRYLRGRLERGIRAPDGERPGRGRAQSLDFDGLSPYTPGDDIRTIDWRASLRSGNTTVRRYAAASHRARILALDLKPSLYFGTDERLMAQTLCLTAAWLAWASNLLNEPVGLAVAGEVTAPRRGRKTILNLLDRIVSAYSTGRNGESVPVDFERMAGLTGYQDELCIIGELPDDLSYLTQAGRVLAPTRVMRFFVVEDPVVAQTPRSGRYPVRKVDGERTVFHISNTTHNDERGAEDLRDAGWHVRRARDLLPRWRQG